MLARLGALGAIAALMVGGCYASHRRATDAGPTADAPAMGSCRWAEPTCERRTPSAVHGVCVLDGDVFAFADGGSDVVCTGVDGNATRFGSLEACEGSTPSARRVACCPPSDDRFITGWVFSSPITGTGVDLDESGAACVALPDDPYPIGPFAPWSPAELCDDPLGWSGVPIVFSVRTPGADACGDGVSRAERCEARIEGGRIIVALSIAPAEARSCGPGPSDDHASCVVLPLAAGTYEVLDEGGRLLGSVAVPSLPPSPREPRCAPIPS